MIKSNDRLFLITGATGITGNPPCNCFWRGGIGYVLSCTGRTTVRGSSLPRGPKSWWVTCSTSTT